MTTEDALKWAFESDWGTDWTKDCQAMVRLAEEVQRLTNEARRFYQADGSFTTLDNPQQVMQLRIIAAGENKRLRAEVERLKAEQKPKGIEITPDQAEELVEFFGGDRESTMTITDAKEGHSGPGLYVYCTDYPEEGSVPLGPIDGTRQPEVAEAVRP